MIWVFRFVLMDILPGWTQCSPRFFMPKNKFKKISPIIWKYQKRYRIFEHRKNETHTSHTNIHDHDNAKHTDRNPTKNP